MDLVAISTFSLAPSLYISHSLSLSVQVFVSMGQIEWKTSKVIIFTVSMFHMFIFYSDEKVGIFFREAPKHITFFMNMHILECTLYSLAFNAWTE